MGAVHSMEEEEGRLLAELRAAAEDEAKALAKIEAGLGSKGTTAGESDAHGDEDE